MSRLEIMQIQIIADVDIARRAIKEGQPINDALDILQSDLLAHVEETMMRLFV